MLSTFNLFPEFKRGKDNSSFCISPKGLRGMGGL